MEKVIILRKLHVKITSFVPSFSTIERNSTYSQFTCQFITYSINLKNLDWCECGSCKNEAREIGCLCCREEDAVLIALAKMPDREGSILPSSFYEHLPDD